MIQITDPQKCCGCTACASVCPRKCISMNPDEEGFLYPVVDVDDCINCRLCEVTCPIIENKVSKEFERISYVIRNTDLENVKESTSGGIFKPVAEWFFENDGVICAAGYGEAYAVKHVIIDSRELSLERALHLYKFRGSKYVQSDMSSVFTNLKKKIQSGRPVCFIGTTCQVAALKSFLRKDYSNLFTIDLVCHGTPSPLLWEKYVDYQQKKYNAPIVDVCFRSKVYGYHSGGMMCLTFANGRQYCSSARTDFMLKSFFEEIASRPICYNCPFKQVERNSDLTVYDCWHFSKLTDGEWDDDNGYTNMIVQSSKGVELLSNIHSKLDIRKVDMNTAIELDGIMIKNSAKPHSKRELFYKDSELKTISEMVNAHIPITMKDYIIEIIKQGLYKIGFLQIIKNQKMRS